MQNNELTSEVSMRLRLRDTLESMQWKWIAVFYIQIIILFSFFSIINTSWLPLIIGLSIVTALFIFTFISLFIHLKR